MTGSRRSSDLGRQRTAGSSSYSQCLLLDQSDPTGFLCKRTWVL